MKLLFFAPHAAIWPHAFPEALVAEALRDSGHEIVYVTCGRQFKSGCIAMAAHGVSSDSSADRRAAICRSCEGNKALLRREFGFGGSDIADELALEDLAEINRILIGVRPENLLELEACGVKVGRAALYEFLLTHKKSTLVFESDTEWRRYLVALENTLYATFAARRIIQREVPDAVVVYNALYSVNQAVCRLAETYGKPHYFLHAGGNLARRLQTLMISKGDIFNLMRQAIDAWSSYRDQPIDASTARLVTDHFLELLRGRSVFVYSSPRTGSTADLRKKLRIGTRQKVLCATLSSYDERFAAEAIGARPVLRDLLFATQVDWVRALIEYVAARPELFLVIRVHPREFPNKREGVKSVNARQWESLFRELPANVAINWPMDNLSLYDLAEISDVFLNAWSSVGKEMAMLGIPVVLYSPNLPLYPADLNYISTTRADYFAAIERALADGCRYENIVRVYRWCAVEYERLVVDISDAFDAGEDASPGLLQRVVAKLMRLLDPYRKQKRDCRRRPHPIAAKSQVARLFESGASSLLDAGVASPPAGISVAAETHALRAEIGRILHAIYPDDRARQSRLGRWLTQVMESPEHA